MSIYATYWKIAVPIWVPGGSPDADPERFTTGRSRSQTDAV